MHSAFLCFAVPSHAHLPLSLPPYTHTEHHTSITTHKPPNRWQFEEIFTKFDKENKGGLSWCAAVVSCRVLRCGMLCQLVVM